MKAVGFSFNKLYIERNKESEKTPTKDFRVNTHIEITDLDKPELELFPSMNVFSFKYLFKVTYSPEIADLIFEGSILVNIPDQELTKKIQKEWKNKIVLEEIRVPLLNLIYSKCNLRAFQMEEELNLPLHMPLPRLVSIDQEEAAPRQSNEIKSKDKKDSKQK